MANGSNPILIGEAAAAAALAPGQVGSDEAPDHGALEEHAAGEVPAVAVDATADDGQVVPACDGSGSGRDGHVLDRKSVSMRKPRLAQSEHGRDRNRREAKQSNADARRATCRSFIRSLASALRQESLQHARGVRRLRA